MMPCHGLKKANETLQMPNLTETSGLWIAMFKGKSQRYSRCSQAEHFAILFHPFSICLYGLKNYITEIWFNTFSEGYYLTFKIISVLRPFFLSILITSKVVFITYILFWIIDCSCDGGFLESLYWHTFYSLPEAPLFRQCMKWILTVWRRLCIILELTTFYPLFLLIIFLL